MTVKHSNGRTSDAAIIHTAATAAAGVGMGLAQLPGSDAPVLVGIQAVMILALADNHGVSTSIAAATEMALTLGATMIGRTMSQWLTGWMPGVGNVINAATAAAVTEGVGHAAIAIFEARAPRLTDG